MPGKMQRKPVDSIFHCQTAGVWSVEIFMKIAGVTAVRRRSKKAYKEEAAGVRINLNFLS